MKGIRISQLLFFFAFVALNVSSLTDVYAQKEYGDFVYEKQTIKERKPVPYPFLREADVMYARRIERVIDTREKMNIIMNWPKSPFHKFIYDGVITGFGGAPIPAYKNDSLVSTYTAEEVLTRGAVEEVVQVYPDPENYPDWYIDSVIYSQFRPEDIIRYRIIEDWILDKQRGMFFPRIIAIAPLYRLEVEGQDLGEQALFYVKWDDLRPILTNQEVFNRHNDRSRLSFDDFFEHRLFSSYIVKESNAFDYDINKFEHFKDDPFAALLESEKIKNKLFEWEHDLWKY